MKWIVGSSTSNEMKCYSFFNSGCEMKINEIILHDDREMRWNEAKFMKFNETRPWEPTKRFIEFYQKSVLSLLLSSTCLGVYFRSPVVFSAHHSLSVTFLTLGSRLFYSAVNKRQLPQKRLNSELVLLLFLQTHRETDLFFEGSGVHLVQSNSEQFHYHRSLGVLLTSESSLRSEPSSPRLQHYGSHWILMGHL
jgi:hypothetical protein